MKPHHQEWHNKMMMMKKQNTTHQSFQKKDATTCKNNDTKQLKHFQRLFLHLTACDWLIRFRLFDRGSITCLPLSLIRYGSLDPSYPRRWQQADNTGDQRLSSPLPLGRFWWFHCGTDRQTQGGRQAGNQYMIEGKTKTCVYKYCERRYTEKHMHTYFMWAMREIQTSNIHPCLDHLLEFGDWSGCRAWKEHKHTLHQNWADRKLVTLSV